MNYGALKDRNQQSFDFMSLIGWLVVFHLLFLPAVEGICHRRWDCPCEGALRVKRFYDLAGKAKEVKEKTKHLLNTMEQERFRNRHQIQQLRRCVEERSNAQCGTHLDYACLLEGLPLIQMFEHPGMVPRVAIRDFLERTRHLLSSLAIWVEQARKDEIAKNMTLGRSLHQEIRAIEEPGIYQILCALQREHHSRKIAWQPNLSREILDMSCRNFSSVAPSDNRNYMVFYTLKKLLSNLELQFNRGRHEKRLHIKPAIFGQ